MPRKLILHKRNSISMRGHASDSDQCPTSVLLRKRSYSEPPPEDITPPQDLQTPSKQDPPHKTKEPKGKMIIFEKLNIRFSRDEMMWGPEDLNHVDQDGHQEEDIRDFREIMAKSRVTENLLKFFNFCRDRRLHRYVSALLYVIVVMHVISSAITFLL